MGQKQVALLCLENMETSKNENQRTYTTWHREIDGYCARAHETRRMANLPQSNLTMHADR